MFFFFTHTNIRAQFFSLLSLYLVVDPGAGGLQSHRRTHGLVDSWTRGPAALCRCRRPDSENLHHGVSEACRHTRPQRDRKRSVCAAIKEEKKKSVFISLVLLIMSTCVGLCPSAFISQLLMFYDAV